MSLSTNTTYRVLLEKIGGSNPDQFIGDAGEVFYNPSVPALKLSDGSTPGGISIGGTGGVGTGVTYITAGSGISVDQNTGNVTITATGGGGGGETYWVSTAAGIHTLSNVGVGTTNPQTKLEINGILGFGTIGVNYFGGTKTNIRIGDNTTGANLTSGSSNIFIGANAGSATTSGFANIFIGDGAGDNNTGTSNQFIGYAAGRLTTTGNYNNFFGVAAGEYNTTGGKNNFFGNLAGYYNSTGDKNSFFGQYAGYYNSTGSYNIFFGHYAGFSASASRKVILGSGFDFSNPFDAPDITKDTQFAVGVRTDSNPTNYWLVGNENFNIGIGTTNPQTKLQIGGVLGFGAGNNVRIGDNTTGANITSGTNNIFMGVGAGNSITTGSDNNFFGKNAGKYTTTANSNIFLGGYSGSYNTVGGYNIMLGVNCGLYNTLGSSNNFIGYDAGYSNVSGNYNIFFGAYTGISTTASNKVILGRGSNFSTLFDSPDTDKDTQFAVGVRTDSNPANYWLVGNENFNVGIGTTNPTSKLTVQSGDVKVGVNTSQGIILTDSNGVAWRLFVNTDGTLGTVAV